MAHIIDFKDLSIKVDADERLLFLNFHSSAIAGIAYHLEDNALYIVYQSDINKRYVYTDVPLKVFIDIAKAESIGMAIIKFKKSGYEYYSEPNR